MNDRTRSDRTGARAARVAASSLLAISALSVGVGSALAAGGSGSIWTTDEPCTAPAAQNQNLYAVGDTVYVRGENFDASSALDWAITGQPGGASGDPGDVVAAGSSSTDVDGEFCLGLYAIAADDWGVYTVDVNQGRTSKNDNYRVDGPGAPEGGSEDPGNEITDPGNEITDPADETTPVDETTDPGDETDDPADETIDGSIETPSGRVDGDSDADQPADSSADEADDSNGTPRWQSVLGSVSTDDDIELPPTDTVSDAASGTSSIFLILGLAGFAGAAVLFAPIRRREPDATE
ncbi:MAG: hypothetical protein EPO36_03535 [Chloroflexota bacterium]|nr:MAG: hypothetical protein EPO36_03535 [Chloroflexota bacterium]